MTTKYLDSNGLLYLWQKIRTTFVSDVAWDSTNKKLIRKKKTGVNGAEESTDLVTFSTVATSGSYNDLSNKPTIPTLKNVFGKVKVGASTIEADTTQDTLELAAGSNVTLTADTTNDKVTIAATDTTYSDFVGATNVADGTHGLTPAPLTGQEVAFLCGSGDWYTLALNSYSLSGTQGLQFELNDANGDPTFVFGKFDFANGGDTDRIIATTSNNGLMSASDKSKLNGIASGAEVNVQSDWNQTTTTADDYIKNKPTIPDDKIFTATFNQTTYTELNSALVAGKFVRLLYENRDYALTYRSDNNFYFTSVVYDGTNRKIYRVTAKQSSGTQTQWSADIGIDVAPLNSPAFTGTPTAPTATAGTNTTQIATTEFVKSAVETAVTGATAFQGTVTTTFAPTNYKAGYYWVVGTAGTYAGETCEAGDMIFATADYSSAYSASDFDVVQTNLDITAITNAEIDTIVAA